jgi:hypothetical protein
VDTVTKTSDLGTLGQTWPNWSGPTAGVYSATTTPGGTFTARGSVDTNTACYPEAANPTTISFDLNWVGKYQRTGKKRQLHFHVKKLFKIQRLRWKFVILFSVTLLQLERLQLILFIIQLPIYLL